ncbi:hypothetical protein KCU81_g9829, partial [Aureobasidium melanogenum]|uniref:Uncharacterized protein n=1 Tax=Aureobasidium melanogenum (strain CBS 110374) TaxID=1043003 RepID=A0A074VNR4_AURM1
MEEAFEKMLPIFHKAANTPEQITQEEKHVLQQRISPQEEDAAVKARTDSKSFKDLVRKCLTDGRVSTLTDEELKMLSRGVQPLPLSTANALMEIQEKQTADVQAMIEQAYKNIADADEMKASLAAHKEINRRAEVACAERRAQRASQPRRILEQSARTRAAARNAPYPNGVIKRASEAIQRYALKSQTTDLQTFPDDGIWGFACFRTSYNDDATWNSFKQQLDSKIQKELQRHLVPEAMQKGFRLVYLENETELAGGLDQTRLTTFFNRIKNDTAIVPRSIDRNFFISIDDAILRASVNAVDPLIILHDADVGPATATQQFPAYSGVTAIQFITLSIPGIEGNRNSLRSSHSLMYG